MLLFYTDWNRFKDKLISSFGNVAAFKRKVHRQFNLSSRTNSIKELVGDLAPRMQTLVTTLESIAVFHPNDLLNKLTLTPPLKEAIIKHLPPVIHPQFHTVNEFTKLSTYNTKSPLCSASCLPSSLTWRKPTITSQLSIKTPFPQKSGNKTCPSLSNIITTPNPTTGTNPSNPVPPVPTMSLRTNKHFTCSVKWEVKKLSDPEIMQIMDTSRLCPSCGCFHRFDFHLRVVFKDCSSKTCPKGCKHNDWISSSLSCMQTQ